MPQVQTPYDRRFIEAVVADVRTPGGSVLSEHALLPILHGESHPYVIDSFSFRVVGQRDPAFAEPMWRSLEHHRFSAVVLLQDPTTKTGRAWFARYDFGSEFVEHLLRDYHISATHGWYCVLRPNAQCNARRH